MVAAVSDYLNTGDLRKLALQALFGVNGASYSLIDETVLEISAAHQSVPRLSL